MRVAPRYREQVAEATWAVTLFALLAGASALLFGLPRWSAFRAVVPVAAATALGIIVTIVVRLAINDRRR